MQPFDKTRYFIALSSTLAGALSLAAAVAECESAAALAWKPALKMPSMPFGKKKGDELDGLGEDPGTFKGSSRTRFVDPPEDEAPAKPTRQPAKQIGGDKPEGDVDLKEKTEEDVDGEPKSRVFRPGIDRPMDEAEQLEEQEYRDNQEQKRKSEMLKELTAPALSAEERDPERYYRKALALTKQKQYKEALDNINNALKLKPLFWEAQIQGAVIMTMQGRDDEAIERYKHIVNLRPDLLTASINLGSLLAKKGEYAAAEEQYKSVINRNFYMVSAHFNLANLYIKQGKFDSAIKELKTCIKMKPSHAWAHNNLGVVFQKRNFLEEAHDEFAKALSLQPSNKIFEGNLNMMRTLLKKKTVKA